MIQIKFDGKNATFFSTLRSRVDNYFVEKKIKPSGNWKLYCKTLILFLTLATLYIVIVFLHPSNIVAAMLCILLGLNFAAIGFNVMHDGSHGSYSSKRWVNEMMGFSLNLMGGNSFFWNQKHNVSHHSFTNIEGADEDIDIAPFMRVNDYQPKYWIHKFQHIYFFLLYCLTYVVWIFYQDFVKYFTGKVGDRNIKSMVFLEHLTFWVTKLIYIGIFIVVPIFYVGLAEALIGYSIMAITTGFVIAIVFQLAHVVENVTFVRKVVPITSVEADWATHQIATTANFGTKSRILSWFLGGLNFQVEHHLFPKISHIHYFKINKIVRETCAEFNVMYNEFPTMLSAVYSHLVYLKRVGN